MTHPPLGQILGDVAGHAQGVVRTEIQLAVAQVRDEVSAGARLAIFMGGAGVVAVVGLVLLFAACALFLATMFAAWVAVLIVAALALATALLLLMVARKQRGDVRPPAPK